MNSKNNFFSNHIFYLYMILAAVCLGTIGVLVKKIGDSIHFMTLNYLRFFFGMIFLLFIIPFVDKHFLKVTKKDIKDYFLIGLVYALALSFYTTANRFAPIQNVVLINYIYPFIVLILAAVFLKEKITRVELITAIIAFIGLAIINPLQFGKGSIGNLLSLIGSVFYAIMITSMRKENQNHSIGDVWWFLFFASIILLPSIFVFGLGDFFKVWHYVVLLGLVSTAFAYLFYNLALENLDAEIGSIIATIITPLVSISLAFFILGEIVKIRTIIGGFILICAGIYLQIFNKKCEESVECSKKKRHNNNKKKSYNNKR
jgi:drug/metabolite transporter (DMT)-like permease